MRRIEATLALVTTFGVASLALGGTATDGSAASDPFYGTWTLDRAHSRYARESPPERMTIVIEPEPNGLAYRSETEYPGGRKLALHYVAHFDGVPALVVGTTGFLAPISLARVDAATIDAVYRVGFKKVASSHWSLNAERSELQVTTTSLSQQGEEIQNVAVFRRLP